MQRTLQPKSSNDDSSTVALQVCQVSHEPLAPSQHWCRRRRRWFGRGHIHIVHHLYIAVHLLQMPVASTKEGKSARQCNYAQPLRFLVSCGYLLIQNRTKVQTLLSSWMSCASCSEEASIDRCHSRFQSCMTISRWAVLDDAGHGVMENFLIRTRSSA